MSMRLHVANQSKLLRSTGTDRCKYCGTPVEWFDRYDTQRIPLTPEVPSGGVPARFRWHVSQGVAYPGADPRSDLHCRLPHPAVCPALEHRDLPDELNDLVVKLGVRMRAQVARGRFVPFLAPEAEEEIGEPEPQAETAPDNTRHTMQYSEKLRLAPGRIEDLRCIAALEDGERCPNGVFVVDEGAWELADLPHAPGRAGQMLLSQTGGAMWVWSLKGGDFTAVTRWLKQRCPVHEGPSNAPDHGPREWVEFHPLRHSEHVVSERPQGYDPPSAAKGITVHDGPRNGQQCATDGCYNTTVTSEQQGWLCWRCAKSAKRREHTRRRRRRTENGR